MKTLEKEISILPGCIQQDVLLSPFSAYNVGGFADYFCAPKNEYDLKAALKWSEIKKLPKFVLGSGTNILVADQGYRGLVIWMQQCCSKISLLDSNTVQVGGGVLLYDLVLFAERNGLKGISHLSGIPGTVGGAVHMNAGAFDVEIGDLIDKIYLIDMAGQKKEIGKDEAEFAYRKAPGLIGHIILGCTIKLSDGDRDELALERQEILHRRSKKQPLDFPSCGSVFKRPQGDYAGRLIDLCELPGKMIGDAQVSKKHANFILNKGEATAEDIFSLINLVQKIVHRKTGVTLEPEVKLIGFHGEH